MALPEPNVLSAISKHLSSLVTNFVSGSPQVCIGPPADAEPKNGNTDPMVNLFLYRIEPSGFFPDITTREPWYVRVHCLVTAYGSMTPEPGDGDTNSSISAGEINLRLLGSVLQVFHENPVQNIVFKRTNTVTAVEEEIATSLQIVFAPLSTEEINQIWGTQGDVVYRSSVAYELAMAPIVPMTPRAIPAPVGSVDLSSRLKPLASTSAGILEGGANGEARLNLIADPERALIEKGKADHSELAPELLITNPPRGDRMSVRGWLEIPAAAGAEPVFKTELDAVELTFTPYAGLSEHVLFVFGREGQSWRQMDRSPVSALAQGQTSKTISFAVPKRVCELMIYVESQLAADGQTTIVRSNIVSLSVVMVSGPPTNGGGP